MPLELPITSSTVPEELQCVITNARWQQLIELLLVTLPDGSKINFGSTEPQPVDRIWPWWRTNSDGTPDRQYVYALGKWLSKHTTPPGIISIYKGVEASIDTLDGGEAGVVTTTSGPFWQRDATFNAKFPVGVGAFAHEGTVAVGDIGGKDQHAITIAEMPTHDHGLVGKNLLYAKTNGTVNIGGGTDTAYTQIANEGGNTPHPQVPPFIGVFFIARTQRLYYRVP